MNTELEDETILFKTKSSWLKIESDTAIAAHKISQEWLRKIDEHLALNLDKLTCDNIREMYFALFGELKRWRSSSSGFTGFSEFLIFRILYNMIGEDFRPEETGDLGGAPILFKSENYEIGQSVRIQLGKIRKFPDIYVRRKGKLISIIQVKIVTGGGDDQIKEELETFRLFRKFNPDIKGLFITFLKNSYTEQKDSKLKNVGYRTVVLEGNHKLISNVLKEAI
jgi:hypothetical protein